MELSKDTVKGLANIQNANVLPEETFLQIIEIAVSHICQNTAETKSIASLYGSKPDVVKRAFIDVTSLLVEAARHDFSEENLENFLHAERISGPRVDKLRDAYSDNKKDIQMQLELTGNSLPHIVDIDWRLDYCIKSGSQNFIGAPLYHMRLSTKKHSELKYVTFTCTLQQLQELVYKLKDAVRHVEKIANI